MGHVQKMAKLNLEFCCSFSTSVGSVLYLQDDIDNNGDYWYGSVIRE
jgi:hypothetical protein